MGAATNLSGILIPTVWDENGAPKSLALLTDYEGEHTLLCKEHFHDLKEQVGKRIRIVGNPLRADDKSQLEVQSFSVLDY